MLVKLTLSGENKTTMLLLDVLSFSYTDIREPSTRWSCRETNMSCCLRRLTMLSSEKGKWEQ